MNLKKKKHGNSRENKKNERLVTISQTKKAKNKTEMDDNKYDRAIA